MTSTAPRATGARIRRLPDFDATATPTPSPRHPERTRPPLATSRAGQLGRGGADPEPAHQQVWLTVRRIMEVLDGRRPAAQLTAAVTPPVFRYLVAAAGQLDEPRLRPRPRLAGPAVLTERRRGVGLRSMRVCQPDDHVAEVCVVWRYRGRFRALAARFELAPSGCWRCTALRIG